MVSLQRSLGLVDIEMIRLADAISFGHAAIIRHACSDSALPTAAYASCVSRAWRAAVQSEPDVWREVDLSYGWSVETFVFLAYVKFVALWRIRYRSNELNHRPIAC